MSQPNPTPAMTRDDVIRATAQHIQRVGQLLGDEATDLIRRIVNHDASKWSEAEWPIFETATPKLAAMTYGSDEYKQALADIKPALEHHYSLNSHHPEHHKRGIAEMSLPNLIEMLCDWKAAGERHNDGSIYRSLVSNKARFGIPDALFGVLVVTCYERAWITWEERAALLAMVQEIAT